MPFLKIQTNHPLPEPEAKVLAAKASALVAEQLGKPERYVMVSVECNSAMQFAPLAFQSQVQTGSRRARRGGTSHTRTSSGTQPTSSTYATA